MKGEAKLSVLVLLAIPMLFLGTTLLERALRLFPDECCALYIPLWLVLLIACPLCGLISIVYSALRRGCMVRTVVGVILGVIQIGVGVFMVIAMNRMISIPMQT